MKRKTGKRVRKAILAGCPFRVRSAGRSAVVLRGLALLILVTILHCPVYAQTAERQMDTPAVEDYLLQQDWADLFDSQPFTLDQLREKSFPELLQLLKEALGEQLHAPLRTAARVLAVVLLLGIFRALCQDAVSAEVDHVLQSVVTAAAFLLLCSPVLELMQDVQGKLESCRVFLTQLIPVLCSVLTASGQIASAGLYSTVFFGAVTTVSQLMAATVSPLIRMFLALSITRGLSGSLRLDGIIRQLKKVIHWGMGLIAAAFSAYLSFQNVLAHAGDSVTLRAGKMMLAGGVPIVGGALSDAVDTVTTGLQLVKSATGVLGIAALALLFLPELLRCLILDILTRFCAAVAQMTDNTPVQGLLEGVSDSVRMLGAITAVYLMLLILGLAMAILLTNA